MAEQPTDEELERFCEAAFKAMVLVQVAPEGKEAEEMLEGPGCRCGGDCDFPCWQRVGIAPPCEVCGCDKREPEGEHLGDRIDQEEGE